ncbi:TIM barrel protein [Streptomyces sp. NBUA17]
MRTPTAGYVANISVLFASLPLPERPAAAAGAGFTAIETWWPFDTPTPAGREADDFTAAVRAAGVELVALNLFHTAPGAGESGILSHPGRAAEFHDNLAAVHHLARELGVRLFCAPYGRRLDGVSREEQRDTAVARLAEANRTLADVGGRTMLEPLSGVPGFPLRTLRQAAAVIGRVDACTDGGRSAGSSTDRSTGLLADLYHLAANGSDLEADLAAHASLVAHVQIADHPGRHEPGTGTLAVGRHIDTLLRHGYRGRFALEYLPTRPVEAPLGQGVSVCSTGAPRAATAEGR